MTFRSFAAATRSAVIVLLAAWSSTPSAATGWRAEGTPLAQSDSPQQYPVICGDAAGGAYIAWPDGGSIRLQRVSPDGVPAPGWSGEGIFGSGGRFGSDPTLAPDGHGGVFVAWRSDHVLNYSHVSPDGSLSAGATASSPPPPDSDADSNGPHDILNATRARPSRVLKGNTSLFATLVPDSSGSAYLIWQDSYFTYGDMVRIGRLLPNGLPDPAWPWAFGMDTTSWTNQYAPVGCTDGSGGAILAWQSWREATGSDVAVGRMTRDGVIAPRWGRSGMPVCRARGNQGAVGIVSDGAGGAFVAWQDERDAGRQQVFAQRITADGVPARGWPLDGVNVCPYASAAGTVRTDFGEDVDHSSLASDGQGGVFIAWSDQRADGGDIYCQRLLSDGSVAPGWRAYGNAVCGAPGAQTHPTIAADGTGGVLLAWEDRRGPRGSDVYATRLAADGTVVAGWPPDGRSLCTQPWDQARPVVTAGPGGGPIVAWQDERCGPSRAFASLVGTDGTPPTGPPLDAPWATWLGWDVVGTSLRVAWQITGDGGPVLVERSEREGPWGAIATLTPDPAGRVEFADSTVIAMCPYHYRLVLTACGPRALAEDSVDAPMSSGLPRPTAQLRSANATRGVVSLVWDGSLSDSFSPRIERAEACGSGWSSIAWTRDSFGALSCRDSGLFEGRRYAYHVSMHACGHDEISAPYWTEIPRLQGFLRMSAEVRTATVDHGTAHVAWNIVTGPATTARVYRLDPGGETTMVASYLVHSAAELRFDDPERVLGNRVGYRVGLQWDAAVDCRGPEELSTPVWLHVTEPPPPPPPPTPPPPVALSLSVLANPALSAPEISLGLPTGDPASLELYDARGRMLWSDDVGTLGPGVHPLRLTAAAAQPPGVYLLRLHQLGITRTARLAIIR